MKKPAPPAAPKSRQPAASASSHVIPEEERRLFREAVAGAQPLPRSDRIHREPPPPAPVPRQRLADERAVLRESLEAPWTIEDRLDAGDEPHYLRRDLARQVLRDLRRGRWVIEAEVDLHGATRDQAREQIAEFLAACLHRDKRCIRIVHGRGLGSPGRIGLLKLLVRGWLMQRDEVLAYCQARPQDGGEGALIVLLRARRTS